MGDRELEIFELCERLAELLGDKEAIADLKRLYEHHPEMFKDMQEVSSTIKEVVEEPDLIIDNPRATSQKDFIVAKQILESNNKKMGDIGIRNSKGTNVIYHTNKQDKRNFNRFINKAVSGEAVRSLHTLSQKAQMGGNDKSSGANTLSETVGNIIPQKETTMTTKEYRPISDSGESSEEPREFGDFFPLSYYDLSELKDQQHIKCADELFNGNIAYEDIREIFLVMSGAGNSYDNQTFEIQTDYPSNLINYMKDYNDEIHKFARKSLDFSSTLESRIKDLGNITIHTKIQDKEVSFTCDKLMRLIDKGLVKDEESLLIQDKNLHQENTFKSLKDRIKNKINKLDLSKYSKDKNKDKGFDR